MSNIEPNIIDPTKTPGGVPPTIDPQTDDLVEPDDIREPDDDGAPVEPDPEETGDQVPVIRT